MQFNLTTDYAIRILMYLASSKQATALELSHQLKISKSYITRMMQNSDLVGTYIEANSGFKGGYRLKMSSREINLLDVIVMMEKTIFINCCLEDIGFCEKCYTMDKDKCAIKKIYSDIQSMLVERLSNITIYDLVNQ